MKTVILADIHHKTQAVDQILANIKEQIGYDHAIFLGDFQDDFGDSPSIARETATWVKNRLDNHPEDVLLMGNHDIMYKYPDNIYVSCSGFATVKANEINAVMDINDWNKIKYFHVEQGILFSHAGVSKSFLDLVVAAGKEQSFDYTLDNVVEKLNKWVPDVEKCLAENRGHWLVAADYTRGGSQKVGGLNWVDHSIFEPTPLFSQIYGHTPYKVPDFKFISKYGPISISPLSNAIGHNADERFSYGFSLDLDTHLRHFAILEDGVLSIYQVNVKDNSIEKKIFERNLNSQKYD
jgi:hypothetical protein